MTNERDTNTWIIDTGDSNHMTGNLNHMHKLQDIQSCPVGVPNGQHVTSLARQTMSGYCSPMHPNPSPFSVHSYWVGCCQWESNPQPDL